MFSDVARFVRGENASITCSIQSSTVVWTSPVFPNDPVILNLVLRTNAMRLDGLIVFDLIRVQTEPKCATATATIANIRESVHGLSLKCTNGNQESKVTISVIGKLILQTNVDKVSFLKFCTGAPP